MAGNSSDNYSHLLDKLKDTSAENRLEAIREIRQNCDPEFYDYLVAIFKNDPSPEVRAESAETLVWLALNNLSDEIIQDLRELFGQQQKDEKSVKLQATLLSSIVALKNLENLRRLIKVQDNLTAESKKDEEKIKRLQERILNNEEEKKALAEQIQKLGEEINSLKDNSREKEQEAEKLIADINALKEKTKQEKIKSIRWLIVAGILLLVILTETIFWLSSQRKIAGIQQNNIQKIKEYETKINEYKTVIYTYEAKLKDLGIQKTQMEENIRKIQEMEEMKKEINKLAGDALIADDETRKFFMKCHDAFFNIDIQSAGVELAYKKKKGFLDAARLVLSGKSPAARKIYAQTLALK